MRAANVERAPKPSYRPNNHQNHQNRLYDDAVRVCLNHAGFAIDRARIDVPLAAELNIATSNMKKLRTSGSFCP
jgi:hypothetical protein